MEAVAVGWPGGALPPVEEWPLVECQGETWAVAPVYLAPVSRAEAIRIADEMGCQLPSVGLVDAIWHAADLKLNPYGLMRNFRIAKDMVAYAEQRRTIEREVARLLEMQGRTTFGILAGSHKDFARTSSGRIDLYGFHDLHGRVIQPPGTSHSPDYCDYSQGVRLTRRAVREPGSGPECAAEALAA